MKFANIYFIVIFFITFSHTVSAYENQYFTQDGSLSFLQLSTVSVKFTRSGIKVFLKEIFNRKEYAQEFLPYDFCHLLQFLEYGKSTKQDVIYLQSVIRLFNNKVKACHFVTAYAYLGLLEKLPEFTEPYYKKTSLSSLIDTQAAIKKLLYTTFLTRFTFFKQDPDSFFTDLSRELIQTVANDTLMNQPLCQEHFRQLIVRFLDITLNKVIWGTWEIQESWPLVLAIAHKLENLNKQELLSDDEFDDLLQSLVERFIYFLDLAGSDLTLDIIKYIKEDLQITDCIFNQIEEQEEHLTSKTQRLLQTLDASEAKIYARTKGIITEVIPSKK